MQGGGGRRCAGGVPGHKAPVERRRGLRRQRGEEEPVPERVVEAVVEIRRAVGRVRVGVRLAGGVGRAGGGRLQIRVLQLRERMQPGARHVKEGDIPLPAVAGAVAGPPEGVTAVEDGVVAAIARRGGMVQRIAAPRRQHPAHRRAQVEIREPAQTGGIARRILAVGRQAQPGAHRGAEHRHEARDVGRVGRGVGNDLQRAAANQGKFKAGGAARDAHLQIGGGGMRRGGEVAIGVAAAARARGQHQPGARLVGHRGPRRRRQRKRPGFAGLKARLGNHELRIIPEQFGRPAGHRRHLLARRRVPQCDGARLPPHQPVIRRRQRHIVGIAQHHQRLQQQAEPSVHPGAAPHDLHQQHHRMHAVLRGRRRARCDLPAAAGGLGRAQLIKGTHEIPRRAPGENLARRLGRARLEPAREVPLQPARARIGQHAAGKRGEVVEPVAQRGQAEAGIGVGDLVRHQHAGEAVAQGGARRRVPLGGGIGRETRGEFLQAALLRRLKLAEVVRGAGRGAGGGIHQIEPGLHPLVARPPGVVAHRSRPGQGGQIGGAQGLRREFDALGRRTHG